MSTTEATERQRVYIELLEHLAEHPDCFPGSCPEGDAIRQALRETR
ncbi:hypothetical protein ACFYXS_02960 [Streptomyces sp. NPDC002574]